MSFSYDDAGNRIRSLLNTYETTYTYDANNRILSKSYGNESVDYTYDNNGNQIKVEKYTKNSDGNKNITETKDYNYNGLNQLTNFNNVTKECSSTYKYMADGYRLSQTVDYDNLFVGHVTETTKYLWDNDNIVSFIDTDNNVKNNYYRGYMLICDDKDEYYMHDPHGNVIETYTADRQPYDYYRYNGYGTQKGFDDTDFVEHNNEWGYCDQLYDNFTHNYYMRARNYDPEIGRFINEDPIRSGSNWYSYCGGNPVNYIDDNGLAPKPIRQLMLAVDIVVSAAQLIKETYDYRGKNITDIVVGVWNDKNKLIPDIGNSFGFDVKQGVFYFKNDTFQKGLGYSNTYDYASAFVGMNIDQKVFEFEYDEKKWRIEMWKGNYSINIGLAGGEVGVYYNDNNSSYYSAVDSLDYLNIKLVIKSEDGNRFVCDTRYTWWQAGFQIGNTALPKELKLYTEIQFKNRNMMDAFKAAFDSMPARDKKDVTICENSKANTLNITWNDGGI